MRRRDQCRVRSDWQSLAGDRSAGMQRERRRWRVFATIGGNYRRRSSWCRSSLSVRCGRIERPPDCQSAAPLTIVIAPSDAFAWRLVRWVSRYPVGCRCHNVRQFRPAFNRGQSGAHPLDFSRTISSPTFASRSQSLATACRSTAYSDLFWRYCFDFISLRFRPISTRSVYIAWEFSILRIITVELTSSMLCVVIYQWWWIVMSRSQWRVCSFVPVEVQLHLYSLQGDVGIKLFPPMCIVDSIQC